MRIRLSGFAAFALLLVLFGIVSCPGKAEHADAGGARRAEENASVAKAETVRLEEGDMLRITTLYDNCERLGELKTNWGFSCLVELGETIVLFDTGGDSPTLMHNIDELGIDLTRVQALVLSHDHGDHTGGLKGVLERCSGLKVYVCSSFSPRTKGEVKTYGGEIIDVTGPVEIVPGIHSTGELGTAIHEQSLVVDTGEGIVVITGCAHPGVVGIVRKAKQVVAGDVLLLMGGFHLMGAPEAVVTRATRDLKDLGVQKVSPSHCTGDAAIEQFHEAFGENFISGGVGLVVEIPLS
jgi:7,8-dihydropterin-6-yl-methyl-4-(beta-D-ribofuranosyl)aminobenzene 5'-phosphate synthase